MRQIEKSKNSASPWENGNNTKMSSISVAKHKKLQADRLGVFSFVPQAQHRLRGTRNIISSEARTSLPPYAAQMNDVALRANDVLRNDVVTVCKQTTPNDVALRANGHAFGVIWRKRLATFPILCYTKRRKAVEL